MIDSIDGIQVVSGQRVGQTAAAERAAADAMHAGDPEKAAALVRVKHAELADRNVPGGFWVATADPAAAEHALTGRIPVSDVRQVAVLSDGAARAVEFGLYDGPDVLDILRESGPDALTRQVRGAEASDPGAAR